jgi:hypothetical protein
MTQLKLSWGLQPPPNATVAWGARAILKGVGRYAGTIDLLHDRQDSCGPMAARKALAQEMNSGGLDLIRERIKQAWNHGALRPDVENKVTLVDDAIEGGDSGIMVEADTRGSCGYLYLVVYKTTSASEKTRMKLYVATWTHKHGQIAFPLWCAEGYTPTEADAWSLIDDRDPADRVDLDGPMDIPAVPQFGGGDR